MKTIDFSHHSPKFLTPDQLSTNHKIEYKTFKTAYLLGTLFSEVLIPTPVAPHVQIPEYFTSQHSRPPTPNFTDYSIRVDGTTIYEPQADARFTLLPKRFFNNNETLSTK